MRERRRAGYRRCLAVFLAGVMTLAITGCNSGKKEPKPEPKATAKVDKGNANADGKGDGQADVPLIAGVDTFSKVFNPFAAQTEADRQAVDLTQIRLVTNDRAGKIIYHGIDGELRRYHEEDYTYYSASDLSVQYDKEKDSTVYNIKIRDDLLFSDGQKLTIDDVLFSLYVLCDNSYSGTQTIRNMPIKGLLNYQTNSTRAESFTEKNLAKKIKKYRRPFVSWLKKQGLSSLAAQISHGKISEKKILAEREKNQELFKQARIYFSRGKGKPVKGISGIRKVGEYELSIETYGYQRRMSAALQIPVCALHYYGDAKKFNPQAGQYGFRRGDISSVLANQSTPMGAGAYRFVKYEEGVAYYTSNELYFLGCPQIAFLQLKEMTDILEETRKNLAQRAAEESGVQEKEQTANQTPVPTTNPSEEVTELKEGTVDILKGQFRGEELSWIAGVNSNQELDGSTISPRFVSDGMYRYLGIHAKNVSVGGQEGTEASKSLRRAIAVLFSGAKAALKNRDGAGVELVSYPMGRESWVTPEEEDDSSYKNIFEKDSTGNELYASEDSAEEQLDAAAAEALEALKSAGYLVENGKVVKAPAGASLSFDLWLANGEENPFYDMVQHVAQKMQEMGLQLKIESFASTDELKAKLAAGAQQLWIGIRDISDTDVQARYSTAGGGNIFGIKDASLDKSLHVLQTYLKSSERRDAYQECLDKVMEWGVEVPLCEYQETVLFSSSRIKQNSIPTDITPYYSWIEEVQKIKMK